MRRLRLLAAALLLAAAATLHAGSARSQAAGGQESTWDRIQRTRTLRVGCIPELPYTAEDTRTGRWNGFNVRLTEDAARRLGVGWECVPSSWGTVALEIQAGKVDFAMALARTPQREAAIAFAGPMYNQVYIMVNRPGLRTAAWEDYNKPEMRVAAVIGSSNERLVREMLPNATAVGLPPQVGSPSLAVSSGRADAYLSSVVTGIIAKGRNPGVGDLVFPTPTVETPNYIGLARESDTRFAEFMQRWADEIRTSGFAEAAMREALLGFGVPRDVIPDDLRFRGGQ